MASTLPENDPEFRAVNGAWAPCSAATDRAAWYPILARFFEYWLSICPSAERLPGRQHFDPLDIPDVMSRVWLLDVERGQGRPRFRYRLVGTKEVETLQREVTGMWMEDVHPRLKENPALFERYVFMAERGEPTYRKGFINFNHKREHECVENCMVPLARDGRTVDVIAVCSVILRSDGRAF